MAKIKFFSLKVAIVMIGVLNMSAMPFAHAADVSALRQLYAVALDKRGDAIPRALAIAETILAERTSHPLATAYKGSLLTLMAADSWLPWTKLRYVNAGIDTLDDAVAAANDAHGEAEEQAEVYVVCGLTDASLPSMFRREPNARKEIMAAISMPGFDQIDPVNQARVLATAAAFAKKDGDPGKADDLLAQAKSHNASEAAKVYHDRS